MQHALELEDIWTVNNPDLLWYTWFYGKRQNQMARLDFFLVTPEISSKLKETKIVFGYRTDHSALILDLELYEVLWRDGTPGLGPPPPCRIGGRSHVSGDGSFGPGRGNIRSRWRTRTLQSGRPPGGCRSKRGSRRAGSLPESKSDCLTSSSNFITSIF